MRFPWSRYHGSVHGGEDRDVETIRIILARTAWPGTCQVMTPESADSGFTRMLVPTDFSSGSEQAWAVARQLAARLGAEIVLLHVLVEAPLFPEGLFMEHARDVFDAAQRWAENMLGEWTAGAAAAGLEVRWVVCPGVPHEEIVSAATRERADLIVLGTHGRGGLDRALLGSVADRVIRLAPCPVLSVRERE
jgi:universal stress protein A